MIIVRYNNIYAFWVLFGHYWPKKPKNNFLDLDFDSQDDKNTGNPKRVDGGFSMDILEKSQNLGSLGSLILGVIAIF